ncbi:MAG: aspartate aminotransferase family protein [Crocinitomicaceae bacterium]|nr:aspartate aminotransferase family protein [Crocinitomicaceae bacterium]
MSKIESFLSIQAQTNPSPYLIDVDYADGIYIYDKKGKKYFDMIAGVAVTNVGHRHPHILHAIKQQLEKHLHVMVYGEFIQDSPLAFSKKLTSILPKELNCVYPVNSGTEANEAAIKLAKRVTKRTEIISFRGSYHGSTNGSLSISGNEIKKRAYRPLLTDIQFLTHNSLLDIDRITDKTAGVIIETIQGDAGVRESDPFFLKKLKAKCNEVGALLIFDEIQCGMGRAGKNFAFERYGITPDILTLGKALGGGLPIGALVSSKENLSYFTHQPMLGHITTFGGNPVICAAANAFLEVLTSEINYEEVESNGELLVNLLNKEPEILEIRRVGMMFAFDMESFERVEKVVNKCLEYGLISFWFLSHPYSFRLSPPLTITKKEIIAAGEIIQKAIRETR